ncbi:hypothetical protein GQ43DRAFT_393700 [Delitschia confertaspora ATCC 74209]|uniref:Phosphatidate phosphatase APP1 catalytic domain-containing protein n=1 Tax=Delitschia confertaspora ATCC 74209 TaxID=1513339 RepID=A0A9P4JRB2_9PLEO|nr:hypothetical protein GQ43DRAFT_393700 [Delitschia confertaspora ATCC 74209]
MIQPRGTEAKRSMNEPDYSEGREPGSRRRRLAGYLKAANELRQSYQQQYAPGWSRREAVYDNYDDTPGAFPDAAVVRSGDEEMILFPSYARKHIKNKPQAEPGTIQEVSGDGRDVRDTVGAGDAEFWKQQWDNYVDDNAVVDVDVRGWIYSPHKGQMSRKQRLFVGLARQLVGVSAPSPASSREPSPHQMGHRERAQLRAAQQDEIITAHEAEDIQKRGEKETDIAAKGGYSERGLRNSDNSASTDSSRSTSSRKSPLPQYPSPTASMNSLKSEAPMTALRKRASWNHPSDMNASELAEANSHLMERLQHFLAVPMANAPISIFFYNEDISKQRTVYTNQSGHFNIRAALDFVPTHVRILASDKLSATERVAIIQAKGISVISDIDDTIKHSAISSGAREIFRNAFIRELGDLTIEGVKEWYGRMAEMGVQFHYVSNSPWQIYPVISKFFAMAGLPPGSFHLKQYSGMLQGIFEPVAERKKGTLDKIAQDFPERSFILIGDSGEADLEVYTDFVLENPGRVLAVFIRDVTTPAGGGFFDPSIGSLPGSTSDSSSGDGSTPSRLASSPEIGDDDPQLRAAIEASLRDVEDEKRKRMELSSDHYQDDHPERRPNLPPRKTARPEQSQEKLISLSDDETESVPILQPLRRVATDSSEPQKRASVASTSSSRSMPPIPPKKPTALRSPSGESTTSRAPPPPKPRRASSTVQTPSTLPRLQSTSNRPAPPPPSQTYAGMARNKLTSAYNHLPSASSYLRSNSPPPENASSSNSTSAPTSSNTVTRKAAPPPPPPRRGGLSTYPAAAVTYASSKASSSWNAVPSMPHRSGRPDVGQQANSFSTTRTNTAQSQYPHHNRESNLGLNGGNGNGGQPLNKREVLWRQRWQRAEQVLGDKGVVLRSWRVGTDAMGEAERLIQEWKEKNLDKGGGDPGNGSGDGRR